jgi:hypothetical protein
MESNVQAQRFWERAVAAFTGNAARPMCMELGGKHWDVFAFESRQLTDGAITR